jgi:hypothetical protein
VQNNKLSESFGNHTTEGRINVLVVEASSGNMMGIEALSGKTVQIDTSNHRQIDRSKKGLADPSPPLTGSLVYMKKWLKY